MHLVTAAVQWNRTLMRRDQIAKGWNDSDLARAAKVHQTTVGRWFDCEINSARLGKRLAKALGYSPSRYLPTIEQVAS